MTKSNLKVLINLAEGIFDKVMLNSKSSPFCEKLKLSPKMTLSFESTNTGGSQISFVISIFSLNGIFFLSGRSNSICRCKNLQDKVWCSTIWIWGKWAVLFIYTWLNYSYLPSKKYDSMDYFNFRITAIELPCHAPHHSSLLISFGTACIGKMRAGGGAAFK